MTLQRKAVEIDCSRIIDAESFHNVFSTALGFPSFYGRNMEAWIDCMTYLDDEESGMSSIAVAKAGWLFCNWKASM